MGVMDRNSNIQEETTFPQKSRSRSLCANVKTWINPLQKMGLGISRMFIRVSSAKDTLWWSVFCTFIILSFITRMYYITEPYKIVWDEAHFGKFVSWYLNRTFFFDVHPVGGKLLLTLFGYLGGYNGTHSFKLPGESYEGYEGIMAMRVGCALLGSFLVPLSFGCVWVTTKSLLASSTAAAFALVEIGTICLSKFILLDAPLMVFMVASFHGLNLCHANSNREWSLRWWLCLIYTGTALSLVLSVKFVGVFTVLFLGCYTICDLWTLYCNSSKTLVCVFLHVLARILCLILLPIALFVGIFFIHDCVLDRAMPFVVGVGDQGISNFSPGFQMNYVNSSLYSIRQPEYLAYGSVVTIRNPTLGGPYLHSHPTSYPEHLVPSHLQQVTGFRGKDANNLFRILFPVDDPELESGFYQGLPEKIGNDDWIRLFHVSTNSTIRCHSNSSVFTFRHKLIYAQPYKMKMQVGGSEEADKGSSETDLSSMWNVNVIKENGEKDKQIRTMHTKFQLISAKFHCALAWPGHSLGSKWGFGQDEITCSRNMQDPATHWYVETIYNPYMRNITFENVKTGFFSRFLETHRMMKFINGRLVPESFNMMNEFRPWMWPVLYKSQVWYDVQFRIVLLGNPFIFLINFVFLLMAPLIIIFNAVKRTRSDDASDDGDEAHFLFLMKWSLVAFCFHYLPFFFMSRVLYFHHYFPTVQFLSILSATSISYILNCAAKTFHRYGAYIKHITIAFLYVMLALSFFLYCHVGYGHPTQGAYNPDNSTFRHLRFVDDWLI